MKEVWKPVFGNSNYQVSNLGRVKSLDQMVWGGRTFYLKKGRMLKLSTLSGGYKKVYIGGKSKAVHRLVATAFIPNPQNLPCINHKDENPSNNVVDNLEWCTYGYNNMYGTKPERVYGKTRNSPKTSMPVIGISVVSGEKVEFPSMIEAYRTLGVYSTHISDCCSGKRKTAGGYYWKLKTAYL